jgi:hypothetical protein
MLPVRIVVGHFSYADFYGNVWMRKGTSSAAASVVSEVIDPTSAMVVFTNGIGLDISIT